MVLSLLRQSGRVLIGTGMDGQLFEVNEKTRERSEIARLDHGQIHRMLRRQDGYAARGTVVSEVLDAKIISRWGSLRWKANAPRGTAVTVAVRTGNVAEPDETWSDWSLEQTEPQEAA